MAPRDGDAQDESFDELDMEDETESENERVYNLSKIWINKF